MKTLREYIDLVSEGATGKYVGGVVGAGAGAYAATRLKQPGLIIPLGSKGWEVGSELGDKGEELVRDKLIKKDEELDESDNEDPIVKIDKLFKEYK